MNALDLIVIAVIALSALFAFARGFVREVLSIGAWIGAGAVTLYGLKPAHPFAAQIITNPQLADIASGVVIFIVSLIVLSIITSMIAGRVKQSGLSAVDRALGLIFGIARGVVLACLGFLALSWALHDDLPVWVRDARTKEFLAYGADRLKSLIPSETRQRGAATAEQAQKTYEQVQEAEKFMRALSTPTPAASSKSAPPPSGYKPSQIKEMNQLFQSTQ